MTIINSLLQSAFKDQHVWIILVEKEKIYPKSNETLWGKFCFLSSVFIFFFLFFSSCQLQNLSFILKRQHELNLS